MTKMHPSGKPVRQIEFRKLSVRRVPMLGSVIPRLQHPEPKDAIGFHYQFLTEDFDE